MKKLIPIVLCIIILFSLTFPVNAKDITIAQPVRTGEVVEKRGKNSQTYTLSDGSYECVVYSEDRFFESKSGELVEIDNTIVEAAYNFRKNDYAYSNAASDAIFHFAEAEASVLIEYANDRLSYTMLDTKKTAAKLGGIYEYQKLFDLPLSGKNCISYPSVLPQTDLIYSAHNGTLKECIMLHSPDSPSEFTFRFDAKNYDVMQHENGTIVFCDKNGKPTFELGRLFAIDAGDTYTEELGYSINKKADGKVDITLSLSKDYLLADERVFPIVIDPTVRVYGASSTYNSFVAQDYPESNFYMSPNLCSGKFAANGVRRTYIKFNLPSISGEVTRAYILIKKNVGSDPSIRAYRVTGSWSSSSISWNNKPNFTYSDSSAIASHYSNNWYSIETTNIVKSWLSGTANNGFLIKATDESSTAQWTSCFSSDATSDKPELRINYVNRIGSREYQQTPERRYANCMGYALEFNEDIQLLGYFYQYYGMTLDELLEAVKTKAENWMANNIPHSGYSEISSYDSDIEENYFRVVLRVGFDDTVILNEHIDSGERIDFHWWYQTNENNGEWADKMGGAASSRISGSNGIDPGSFAWYGFYNSACVYYKIKDTRIVNWYESSGNNNDQIIKEELV